MSRMGVLLIFIAIPVALGFVASLIFAKPWTRWIATGVIVAYFVVLDLTRPLQLLVAAPFVALVSPLGFGVATLGMWLRRGRTAPQRVSR